MILPDYRIKALGDDLISPFKHGHVQPASIDLTLDNEFVTFVEPNIRAIDLARLDHTVRDYDYQRHIVKEGGYFMLQPGAFVLGSTVETIKMPNTLVARVEGKSSLGRLGLLVHSTAGFIDPGFVGTITLEFCNLNHRKIMLRPGLRICQVSFDNMAGTPDKGYGAEGLDSKYQHQAETTPSRYRG